VSGVAIFFGALVGFSLALTGGGGSIFAVPLLVYGLSSSPREAIGVSLAAVGAIAFVGSMQKLRTREIDLTKGIPFALAGMVGAPIGALIGGSIPEGVLLTLFALLMITVASKMWLKTLEGRERAPDSDLLSSALASPPGKAVQERGRGLARCLLCLAGLGTGVLSGLFGVGGGFVIVPALVLFGGMEMRGAIATSLLVITLVSSAGLAAFINAGHSFEVIMAIGFAGGGLIGLASGSLVQHRLSGTTLQRVFAVWIFIVAIFIIGRSGNA